MSLICKEDSPRHDSHPSDFADDRFLPNLSLYKYSVRDVSPFSIHVLQPYWNYSIRFMPGWIAPNLITLIGFAALIINYLICFVYVPQFNNTNDTLPWWVYFLMGLGVEWYSLMDNLDGRQARRTGTSSPLGELFDHGCDCLAVAFGACTAACVLNYGPGWISFICLMTMSLAFWVATWEEYHTGTLFLGFFNGPTEGLKMIIFSYWLSAFLGPEFWDQTWTEVFQDLYALRPHPFTALLYGSATSDILIMQTVYTTVSYLLANNKPVKQALQQLFAFVLYWGMAAAWFVFARDQWVQYPHYYQMAVGIGFGEMTSRLILGHVCRMRYSLVQRPMAPLAIAVVNAFLGYNGGSPVIPHETMMYLYVFLSVFGFLHYSVCTIDQLTDFLGIRCLVIPREKHYKSE